MSALVEIVIYRYVGDGSWLPGVPARDLTSEEIAALEAEIIEAIEACGLYEKVEEE